MGVVTQILLFVSYAILGVAVAVLPPAFFGLSEQVSRLFGLGVFFGAWQLQTWFSRHKGPVDLQNRIARLEDELLILRGDVERMHREVDTKSRASGEKNDKLVSELKILQTLLAQVMSKEIELRKGGKAKAAAPAPAKPGDAAAKPAVPQAPARDAGAQEKPVAAPAAAAAASPAEPEAAQPEDVPVAETPEDSHNEDQMTQAEIEELDLTPEEAAMAMADVSGEQPEPAVPAAVQPGAAPRRGAVPQPSKKATIRLIKREDQLLSVIRSSLSENRVDLYLQPIVALPARRVLHYECFSRVRDEEGRIILPRQYMKVAESKGLIGTIDNLLLFRLIQLVRRLGRRKPEVRFFCNMSRYSMMDKEFFPQFIDFMTANSEFSGRLVFEISQEDYYALDGEVTDRLATLGRKGFGFSMDLVKDFERDFAGLGKQHFQFIKPDLKDLLVSHPEAGDVGDFKAMLRRNGMGLIASRIENEEMVLEALDAQVELAQGYLFGEPAAAATLTREL